MADLQAFLDSIQRSAAYPLSLKQKKSTAYTSRSLKERLDERSRKLFLKSGDATARLLDVRTASYGYEQHQLSDFESTRSHLQPAREQCCRDPLCRMVFIGAETARSRLNVTQDVFLLLLTYLEVMPGFLDFVFPFGLQNDREDPHTGGFRSSPYIDRHQGEGTGLTDIGRSGRQLEFCYTLQSPERTGGKPPDAWSIRQTSVWHSFDLVHERQSWIVVKANDVIEQGMKEQLEACSRCSPDVSAPPKKLNHALRLALAAHVEICAWSAENWDWYLTSNEQLVRRKTRNTVASDLNNLSPAAMVDATAAQLQSLSFVRQSSKLSRRSSNLRATFWKALLPGSPSKNKLLDEEQAVERKPKALDGIESRFSFPTIQETQGQEEAANSTIMILRSNAEVVQRLREEYAQLRSATEPAEMLDDECMASIQEFEKKLTELESRFSILQARAETYGRLVQERKNLLYAILQAQNMKHTLALSQEGRDSAVRMETMTQYMHGIAVRTQTETVRMRIITVVTLFFLPGTFVSTLMSTQVVKFPEGRDTAITDAMIGNGALQVYVLVSVPLMMLTFLSWYIMHRRERRAEHDEDNGEEAQKAD